VVPSHQFNGGILPFPTVPPTAVHLPPLKLGGNCRRTTSGNNNLHGATCSAITDLSSFIYPHPPPGGIEGFTIDGTTTTAVTSKIAVVSSAAKNEKKQKKNRGFYRRIISKITFFTQK
jgi:hypothetical protein